MNLDGNCDLATPPQIGATKIIFFPYIVSKSRIVVLRRMYNYVLRTKHSLPDAQIIVFLSSSPQDITRIELIPTTVGFYKKKSISKISQILWNTKRIYTDK